MRVSNERKNLEEETMKVVKLVTIFITIMLIGAFICYAGGEKEEPAPAPVVEKEEAPAEDDVYVDEWVIPAINIITGVAAYHGMLYEYGVDLALEEINKSGGIRGKTVRVRWFDEAIQDAARAIAAMSGALDMKPVIVMGPCGDYTKASMPMAVEEGVYCMSTLTGTDVCKQFQPWTLCFTSEFEPQTLAATSKWVELNPGMKKIVHFINTQSSVWPAIAKAEDKGLHQFGIETVSIDVPNDAVNFGQFAVKALAEEPDGFVFTNHPNGMAKIIIELQKRGWDNNNRILLSQASLDPTLWSVGEGHLEGVYAWTWYNPVSDDPSWQKLNERHMQTFGVPASFMMVWKGYDELYLIKQAFEDLKITGDPAKLKEERIAIRDYLNNVKGFDSIFGKVDFVDGIRQNPTFLFKIENNYVANAITIPTVY